MFVFKTKIPKNDIFRTQHCFCGGCVCLRFLSDINSLLIYDDVFHFQTNVLSSQTHCPHFNTFCTFDGKWFCLHWNKLDFFVSRKKTWSFEVSFFSSVYFQFSRFYLWLFNVYGFRLTVVLDKYSHLFLRKFLDWFYCFGQKNEAHTRQPKTVYLFSVNDNKKNMGQHEKYCRFYVLVENQKWHKILNFRIVKNRSRKNDAIILINQVECLP